MLKQYTDFAINYRVKAEDRNSWLSLMEATINYFKLEAMVLVGKPTTTLVADEYAYDRLAHVLDVAAKEPVSIEEFFMGEIVIVGDNVEINGNELSFKEDLSRPFARRYSKEELIENPSILIDIDVINAPSYGAYQEADNEPEYHLEYKDFYFTFGAGQSYADKIQHVKAPSYEVAREIMFASYNDVWAFQYEGDDIEDELKYRNERADFLPTLYPGDLSLQRLAGLERLAADSHCEMIHPKNSSRRAANQESSGLVTLTSLAMPAQFVELPLVSFRALAPRLSKQNNIDRKFYAGAYEYATGQLGANADAGEITDVINEFAFKQTFNASVEGKMAVDLIAEHCERKGIDSPRIMLSIFMVADDYLASVLSDMIDCDDGYVTYYNNGEESGLVFRDKILSETYLIETIVDRDGTEVTQFNNWEANYRFLQLYKRRMNDEKDSKGDSIQG